MDLDAPLSTACSGRLDTAKHGSGNVVLAVFAVLAVTAWARGGSADISPWLQFALASLVLVVMAWEILSSGNRKAAMGILRDPVLYTGVALLVLTGLQWFNSGRELFYDESIRQWRYSDPRHPLLPYAFDSDEAMQVWVWFYCALAVLLAIRSSLVSRHGVYKLWRMLLLNACLLGVFGMIQLLSGTDSIFWLWRLPHQRFFASFGYANHAGSYFFLMLALALSLLVRRIFKSSPPRLSMRVFLLLVCVVMNLICCNLTLSRYAILASWTGVVWVSIFAVRRIWRRGGAAFKVHVAALLLCLGVIGTYGSLSLAGVMLGGQVEAFLQLPDDIFGSDRLALLKSGLSVWRESPWFGVGPWGYRHLVGLHIDETMYWLLRPGTASLHNDALQYLVESGLVGAALIAATIGILIAPFRVAVLRRWMPGVIILAGLGMILGQSLWTCPCAILPYSTVGLLLSLVPVRLPVRKRGKMVIFRIDLSGVASVADPGRG